MRQASPVTQSHPAVQTAWPWQDGPQHPHHFLAVQGWHCVACRANWDIKALAKDFAASIQFSECWSPANPKAGTGNEWVTLVFAPSDGAVALVHRPVAGTSVMTIWASSREVVERQLVSLRCAYSCKPKRKRGGSNFVVICLAGGTLATRTITIQPALRDENDIALHYGNEFAEWQSGFVRTLGDSTSGITVFRGEPGTGKTTFLKFLTRKLRRTHRFYYLPLSVFRWLSNPSAVDFWLNENANYRKLKKVVILEDAESLLMQRASDNQQNVSALLNISDGFLADMLKMHVICTVNCPLDKIDPAIMRPGRLIAIREFVRIDCQQARLVAAAKGISLPAQNDYTLAEVYNGIVKQRNDQHQLGFAAVESR